jgi:hypothetical protein
LGAGPLLILDLVDVAGLPRPRSTVLAQPGLLISSGYWIEWNRFTLGAGLRVQLATLADDLVVGGFGTVAKMPTLELAPVVGVGFRP